MTSRDPDKVERLVKAWEEVETGKLTIRQAASKYNVPKSTLHDKVKGISPLISKKGPSCILSDKNEKFLVQWIKTCGKAGFPVTKIQVLSSVARLVKELKIETPFSKGTPGRKWYTAFLRRNPDLSLRTPQNLTLSRARVTEQQLREWFAVVEKSLKEEMNYQVPEEDTIENSDDDESDQIDAIPEFILGDESNQFEILNDPTRVFNADEAAFFYNPKGNKVLYTKGSKNVYSVISVDEKECVTVLHNVSAAGIVLPPVVVLKYQRLPEKVASAIPSHWGVGNSESGWMTSDTFFEYIANIFDPWLTENNIVRPVILFVDGHVSHLTLHTSIFCRNRKIILIALLANSTHLLQPLDVSCFKTLKAKWLEVGTNFRITNMQPTISKSDFFPLLETAVKESLTESVIKNGFRKCGLLPWNPDALDYSKIRTAVIERTEEEAAIEVPAPILKSEKQIVLQHFQSFLGSDKEEFFLSVKNSSNWPDIVDEDDHGLFSYWRYAFDTAQEENTNQAVPQNLIDSVDEPEHFSLEPSSSDLTASIEEEVIENFETEILTLDSLIDYETIVPLIQTPPVSKLVNGVTLSHSGSVVSLLSSTSICASPLNTPATTPPLTLIQPSILPPTATISNDQSPTPGPSGQQSVLCQPTTSRDSGVLSGFLQSVSSPSLGRISAEQSISNETASRSSEKQSTPSDEKVCALTTPQSSARSVSFESTPQLATLGNSKVTSGSTSSQSISRKTLVKSPQKGSSTKTPISNSKLPSPFKRALPWPGVKKQFKQSANKKVKRELIPVVTAAKWQEFHAKKLKEKEDIEKEKQRKKDEREQKRMEKIAATAEKAKRKVSGKKRKLPSPEPEDFNSENEDEIGSLKYTLQVGDHVIVEYEEEFFPGLVLLREYDKVSVKSMAMAGIDVWKWPPRDDICFYDYPDVKMIIKSPQPFGNRGHFKVPEMQSFK